MPLIRNRPLAALSAVAFVVGMVVVPTLHLAFHALPHDHVGDEIHYHFGEHDEVDDHDEAKEHDHAEAADHDHHDHDHHHDHEPFDPHHGDGSAAHFSLAISDAAASAIVLAISPGAPTSHVAKRPASRTNAAHVSVQRFRGPPPLA